MDFITQYVPLVIALLVGAVVGFYAAYVTKAAVLPADMDKVIGIVSMAIMDAQRIYGDSTLTNTDKAKQALEIASRALADAGIPVNAVTLALIIKIVYHAIKPEIKLIAEPPSATKYSGIRP